MGGGGDFGGPTTDGGYSGDEYGTSSGFEDNYGSEEGGEMGGGGDFGGPTTDGGYRRRGLDDSSASTRKEVYLERRKNSVVYNPATDSDAYLCDSDCLPNVPIDQCASLGCFIDDEDSACTFYDDNTIMTCFCVVLLNKKTVELGYLGALNFLNSEEKDVCGTIADADSYASALGIIGTILVVVINVFLKLIIQKLVKFERHSSASSQSAALSIKVTFAQFLNTACIALLVGAKIGGVLPFFPEYLDGKHKEFVRDWYVEVGAPLCFTMLINVFVPHIGPIVKGLIVRPIKLLMKKKKAVTHMELEDLFTRDRFEIETRYAVLLNFLFVAVIYSGGMPIMLLLASLNFGISYFMDKYALIKIFKRPARYDSQLARMLVELLPLAIFMQLAFSAYTYSYAGSWEDEKHFILRSKDVNQMATKFVESMKGSHWLLDDFLPRIVRRNVLPIVLLLGGFITTYVLFKVLGDVFVNFVGEIADKLLSSFSYEPPELKAAQPDYTAIYSAQMTPEQKAHFEKHKDLPKEDLKVGFKLSEHNTVNCAWLEGDHRIGDNKVGDLKRTWEVVRDAGIYNYDILINPTYKNCCNYLIEKNMFVIERKEEVPEVVVDEKQAIPEVDEVVENNPIMSAGGEVPALAPVVTGNDVPPALAPVTGSGEVPALAPVVTGNDVPPALAPVTGSGEVPALASVVTGNDVPPALAPVTGSGEVPALAPVVTDPGNAVNGEVPASAPVPTESTSAKGVEDK